MPEARVGHLGMYRDEDKLSPVGYYESIPEHGRTPRSCSSTRCSPPAAAPPAPCAAQGARGEAPALRLPRRGPEGLEAVRSDHPDVPIFCAAIDRELDERGYIRPGLGDAGDRLYGTD